MVCRLASSPGLDKLRKFFATSNCTQRSWTVLQAGRREMPESRPRACRSQNGEWFSKALAPPESFAGLEGESCSLKGGEETSYSDSQEIDYSS